MPGDSGVLVVTRVRSTNTKCTRGRGCNGHPAFPTPSRGRKINANLGRIAPRDREVASDEYKCANTLSRRRPRKRAIQYSETPVMESKGCRVPDTPLDPVILRHPPRRLPIIEKAYQTVTDDTLGIRHDAVDQLLHGRNILDQALWIKSTISRTPATFPLPLLAEGSDFQLERPGAAWLLIELPVGFRDRRRRHQEIGVIEGTRSQRL
jgi:hypothetical protein